ncbi:MAG: hypothetical protein ABIT58_08115 [Ferruginibacter sp.]
MNFKTLLFVFSAVAISSCSTTYKSGQTPDDVYYSPAKPIGEGRTQVRERREEPRSTARVYEDRQIVMSMYDPRWRYFEDDYYAYYDPYRYGYTCGYYYNPYYYPSPVYISGAVFTNPKNTTPRMTNLGSYNYSDMVVLNQKTGSTITVRSARAYNNSNSSQNFIRRIITPPAISNNNSSNTNIYRSADNNTRSYTPSSGSGSSSSGSSSSGSSGTPVSRPKRGG